MVFLGGTGEIPDLVSPTLIAPTLNNGFGHVLPIERNDVGTMQLIGGYVQGAGGRLHIEVSTVGSEILAIDGNASLAGQLELKLLHEIPLGTPFTILTAVNGTVTGTFDQIVTPDPSEKDTCLGSSGLYWSGCQTPHRSGPYSRSGLAGGGWRSDPLSQMCGV